MQKRLLPALQMSLCYASHSKYDEDFNAFRP